MKTKSESRSSEKKPKLPRWAVSLAGLVAVVGLVWIGLTHFGGRYNVLAGNYAQQVARPLESTLVDAGAIKKCSSGDAGRGPDNDRPWYRSYFEIPRDEQRAVDTVYGVARENGYSLNHASPTNRGHLDAVADIYIEDWYFDNASKQNPFRDLESGPTKLAFGVNNSGAKDACGRDAITVDAQHSVISIDVQLPTFKR